MARTTVQQKFGQRISYLRHAAGLTQEKLSIATGLSQTYISGIEGGTRNPSLKTIEKFARALGVSVSDVTNFEAYQINEHSRILQ